MSKRVDLKQIEELGLNSTSLESVGDNINMMHTTNSDGDN
jgi:hypothetical protein